MRLPKTLAIITALALLTLTACTSGNTSLSGNTSSTSSNANTSKASSTPPVSSAQEEEWPDTPISDFEYEYNGELQGIVITKYIGNAVKARIPETIEGEPVTGIKGAFEWAKVATVYIPNSVTSIGERAFTGSEITRITIPDSVTSIGNSAFRDCKGLTSIELPDGLISINDLAFVGCTGLTNITIPDSVTNLTRSSLASSGVAYDFHASNYKGENIHPNSLGFQIIYKGITIDLYDDGCIPSNAPSDFEELFDES